MAKLKYDNRMKRLLRDPHITEENGIRTARAILLYKAKSIIRQRDFNACKSDTQLLRHFMELGG